jgi:beta-glucanase (GH16 family)
MRHLKRWNTRHRVAKILMSLSLGACAVYGGQDPASSDATTEGAWSLVWSDEFNKEGLPDTTPWDYDVGGSGWGNNELQYYTARRSENARIKDGVLIIEAHHEAWLDSTGFTSARLVTRGRADWQYGRFEICARLAGRSRHIAGDLDTASGLGFGQWWLARQR